MNPDPADVTSYTGTAITSDDIGITAASAHHRDAIDIASITAFSIPDVAMDIATAAYLIPWNRPR